MQLPVSLLLLSPSYTFLSFAPCPHEAVTADLTAAVCAAEKGCSPTEIDQSTRQEAREELFEHHIPKLAATGVVEYDSMLDRLRLRATGVAERAESELAAEGESPGEAQ